MITTRGPQHARPLASLTARPPLRLGASALAAALLVPLAAAAPASAAPSPSAAPTAAPTASCGELFDDFAYTSSSDPRLAARHWSVRNGGGGPGVDGNTWSASNVDFPGTGAAQTMRLRSTTDGTARGTVNAEVSQDRRFFEGTYAARVRFSDAPVSGPDGDPVVQTFFTITPLDAPNDPDYGEADFEYLPNGGWGQSRASLFLTTYETYQPDPWDADNISETKPGSLAGWHDLTLQIADGTVRYLLDGEEVAAHDGHVYPETPMHVSMNQWFIDLASHTGGVSTWEQEVDYVYYADQEVLTPQDVSARVAAHRAAGTLHTDTFVPGTCTPTPAPTTPAPEPTTPPVTTPAPTPAPTPSTPATPTTPVGVDCDGLRGWSPWRTYRAGATVVHDEHAWQAKRSTRWGAPGSSQRWTDLGACA